jgi:hypothetical protein
MHIKQLICGCIAIAIAVKDIKRDLEEIDATDFMRRIYFCLSLCISLTQIIYQRYVQLGAHSPLSISYTSCYTYRFQDLIDTTNVDCSGEGE